MTDNKKAFRFDPPEKLQTLEGQVLIAETIREFELGNRRADYRGASMQFIALFHAASLLRREQFDDLCRLLGIPIDSMESSTAVEVGERLAIAERRIEDPGAFALLHASTMLIREDFDRFVELGRIAESMDADSVRNRIVGELLEGRRPFR